MGESESDSSDSETETNDAVSPETVSAAVSSETVSAAASPETVSDVVSSETTLTNTDVKVSEDFTPEPSDEEADVPQKKPRLDKE